MDDTPYINDGADTSLRKTVSLLNKIEAKTGSATPTGQYVFGGFYYSSNTTIQQIAGNNPNRVALLISNASIANAFSQGKAYLQYGSTLPVGPNPYAGAGGPNYQYAVVLSPQDYYEIPFWTGEVRCLVDIGGKIHVTEITKTNFSSLTVTDYF